MEELRFERLPITKASEQIGKEIKESILNGNLRSGVKLPTEKEMAIQFGVSIVTLREALTGLQTLGLIEKRKGFRGGFLYQR